MHDFRKRFERKYNLHLIEGRERNPKRKNYIASSARFRVLSARANNVMNITHYRKSSDVSNAIQGRWWHLVSFSLSFFSPIRKFILCIYFKRYTKFSYKFIIITFIINNLFYIFLKIFINTQRHKFSFFRSSILCTKQWQIILEQKRSVKRWKTTC